MAIYSRLGKPSWEMPGDLRARPGDGRVQGKKDISECDSIEYLPKLTFSQGGLISVV